MPIVNGNYVPDTLPGARDAQEQVFGKYQGRTDMSDYSSAAYNYLMKQQEQAYNLELWNLMNEYNSPSAQMKRYQDAGLSPWLIYGQSNATSSPASASAAAFRPGGTMAKGVQAGISAVGQIMNTVRAARETYDYMKYGRTQQSFRTALIGGQAEAQHLANSWNFYLQGQDPSGVTPDSPKARMYSYQMDTQAQRFEQIKAVIESIGDQRARTRALEELDKYRLQILRGQNDAILNIHTGLPGLDSFIRLLGYWLIAQ